MSPIRANPAFGDRALSAQVWPVKILNWRFHKGQRGGQGPRSVLGLRWAQREVSCLTPAKWGFGRAAGGRASGGWCGPLAHSHLSHIWADETRVFPEDVSQQSETICMESLSADGRIPRGSAPCLPTEWDAQFHALKLEGRGKAPTV